MTENKPPIVRQGWAKGINNRADWRRQPEGTVRDAVNFDALPSGVMALRAGYDKAYAGEAVRGALSLGSDILIADGDKLVRFDTRTNSSTVLALIPSTGPLVGVEFNAELFFTTPTQALRYKAGRLRAWGVPTVRQQPVPAVTAGGLAAGTYRLAVTYTDAAGDEGGTTSPLSIRVAAGSALTVQLAAPAGLTPNLYVSPPDGSALYLQAVGEGSVVVSQVADNTARLATAGCDTPPNGASAMAAYNGVILLAVGSTLHMTSPMSPHLLRPAQDFFQYPADIGMLASADMVYVSADKTYALAGVDTEAPQQSEVFPFPAVPGTATSTPTGQAAWMTPYGLAVTSGGTATLLSEENFVPETSQAGSSGVVEAHGSQMVVSSMRGSRGQNPLAARDYYEAEVITT